MPEYFYGRRKELQIGEFLERRGFFWDRSPGSRGAGDLVAMKNSRTWCIQVKATRKDYTSFTRLTIEQEEKLVKLARKNEAQPVLALVSRNFVWFISIPGRKLLLKGELHPLRYVYSEK